MKKHFLLLILVLALLLTAALPSTALAEDSFGDMPPAEHWAYDALQAAVDNGLLSGRSDNSLDPWGELTRAELAAVLNRAFGAVETADISGFSDVKTTDWYYQDMARAVAMGTFVGGEGLLRPNDAVTRQEAFVVLARAFGLIDEQISLFKRFSDADQISFWALPALSSMAGHGYISGSEGRLDPRGLISRAELAQVMSNMVGQYIDQPGSYSQLAAGNVLISCPGVSLEQATVTGRLIVAEGALSGTTKLLQTQVSGEVLLRGAGNGQVNINGGSFGGGLYLRQSAANGPSVKVINQPRLNVFIEAAAVGNSSITLSGEMQRVSLNAPAAQLELVSAQLQQLNINAAAATVNMDADSRVAESFVNANDSSLLVSGQADYVEVKLSSKNASVQTLAGGHISSGDGSPAGRLLRAQRLEQVSFDLTYFDPKTEQEYTVSYPARLEQGQWLCKIDISKQAGEMLPRRATLVANIKGDDEQQPASLSYAAGYGPEDGFKLGKSYAINTWLLTLPADMEMNVGALGWLLDDHEGDNKLNWLRSIGRQWPDAVSYQPQEQQAIVSGSLSAQDFAGAVDCQLLLNW